MKKTHPTSRVLALLLVLMLVFSLTVPALAESAVGEGTNVSWEKIDNDVLGTLPLREAAEEDEAPQYADTDMVRVSIVLESKSTIDAGFSTRHIADNKSAMSYRSGLQTQQSAMANTISAKVLGGSKLDVVWNLTLVANIISANVPYGTIEQIKALDGVANVVIENRYEPCVSSIGGDDPSMATSSNMIGSNPAWASGYTGAGSRVAIIDTGLDTDHQSFSSAGYEYSLQKNAEKLGMSYEEYVAGLNLLTSAEVADKWGDLNFSTRYSADSGNTFFSSKVPFGANYVDKGIDITHDHDKQGEHGSHVAGIAAANSFIPDGGSFVPALDSVSTQGVAPDSQLIVMKVFGKNGGAYDADYMVAIEDAIILDADVINLSLGSANAGASTDGTYQDILDSLANSDTVVSISAGNAGSWADNTYLGYLYSDGNGFDTVGSPGSFTNAFTVASVDNDGATGAYLKVDGEMVFYAESAGYSNAPMTTIAGEQDFVYLDSVGTAEEFAAIADAVKGKVAICNRGETSFFEKMDAAAAAGAIACIVVNNQAGVINMDLTDATSSIPCVSVLQSEGLLFKSVAEYNEEGGYYEGKLEVSNEIASISYFSDYYTMSDFSSMGVPGSLELKPEITAPGGNIYSVNGAVAGGKSYELMSGTSMASPQIAGMTALVAQYIRENGLEAQTGLSARQLTQSLLMSTATPLIEADSGSYYPVMKQGAGLANVSNAITSGSYVMMGAGTNAGAADGKVKVELGDDPARTGEYSFSFTLNNMEDTAKTFQLSAAFFTQDYFAYDVGMGVDIYTDTWTYPLNAAVAWTVDGVAVDAAEGSELDGCDFNGDGSVTNDDGQALLDYVVGNLDAISAEDFADIDADGDVDTYDVYLFFMKFSAGAVVVPANGSVTVAVSVALLDIADFDDCGAYIEGYVFADEMAGADGALGDSHSIPVLGYYGAWDESSMFDVGSYVEYEYGMETRLPYMYAAAGDAAFNFNSYLVSYAGESGNYYFGGNPLVYDEYYMPERNAINGENGDKISAVSFSAVRNAAASLFSIVDSEGTVIDAYEVGPVDCAFYYENNQTWQNVNLSLNTNFKPTGIPEGTQLTMSLTLAPEYYVAEDGSVDWASLNEAASFSMPVRIDNTAPEITDIVLVKSMKSGEMELDVSALDNQYIAAVALFDYDGNLIDVYGSDAEAAEGEESWYGFAIDESCDKYLVQVYDYAMNLSTYKVNFNEEEAAGEITIELSDSEIEILKNTEYKLVAEVGPWGTPDESVTWASSDESVATVSAKGVVTAVEAGECVITATANADETKSASCTVTVSTVNYTLNGALQDADGNPVTFTWNLNTDKTWSKVADLTTYVGSATIADPEENTFYMMDSVTDTWATHLIDFETGEVLADGENVDGIPYWDMACSTLFDGVIHGIYGSYVFLAEDPMAIDAYGYDFTEDLAAEGANYFIAIESMGYIYERSLRAYLEILYLLDDAGNLWTLSLASTGSLYLGGTEPSNLTDLDLPGYEDLLYCSMTVSDDDYGTLFLSAFDGVTSQIYMINEYVDEEGNYFAEAIPVGNVGNDVWPCVLTTVTYNGEPVEVENQVKLVDKLSVDVSSIKEINADKVAVDFDKVEIVGGSLNSAASYVGAQAVAKQPVADVQSVPSVLPDESYIYIDVTAKDVEGADVESTNGLFEISYNKDCLELTAVEVLADYSSVKDNVFGYADLDGIAAGDTVAKLTFKVLDGNDVAVEIKTVEVNNDKVGFVEEIDSSDMFEHVSTEIRGAVDPTCTEEGYTGDLYCCDCGKLLQSGEAIPVVAHNYGDWEVVTAPGCKTPGLEKCVCSECGAEAFRVIPPAGHIADPFNDIAESGYHDGIIDAEALGIVSGYADGSFKPANDVTRAQFITMLWRAAGQPEAGEAAGFADVAEDSPYYNAIMWANAEGIAQGYSATEFKPNQTISRAQMATFMFRYLKNVAGYDFGEIAELDFADADTISSAYLEAVEAIVSAGIMGGVGDGTNFAPFMTANRGMAATVLVRLYNLVNAEPAE